MVAGFEHTADPRTVWLACTLSFCLGLPSLGSAVAFSAATSIATIGLYISYGPFPFVCPFNSAALADTSLQAFRSHCVLSTVSASCEVRSISEPSRIRLLSLRLHGSCSSLLLSSCRPRIPSTPRHSITPSSQWGSSSRTRLVSGSSARESGSPDLCGKLHVSELHELQSRQFMLMHLAFSS